MPSQIALGPGLPSDLRPNKPPKLATSRTISPSGGGSGGGFFRCATIQAACHLCPWVFLAVKHRVTRQVRAFLAKRHQMEDAPGEDEVDHQQPLQPFHAGQLPGFNAATTF